MLKVAKTYDFQQIPEIANNRAHRGLALSFLTLSIHLISPGSRAVRAAADRPTNPCRIGYLPDVPDRRMGGIIILVSEMEGEER